MAPGSRRQTAGRWQGASKRAHSQAGATPLARRRTGNAGRRGQTREPCWRNRRTGTAKVPSAHRTGSARQGRTTLRRPANGHGDRLGGLQEGIGDGTRRCVRCRRPARWQRRRADAGESAQPRHRSPVPPAAASTAKRGRRDARSGRLRSSNATNLCHPGYEAFDASHATAHIARPPGFYTRPRLSRRALPVGWRRTLTQPRVRKSGGWQAIGVPDSYRATGESGKHCSPTYIRRIPVCPINRGGIQPPPAG